MEDLNMQQILAKFVPWLFTDEQKEHSAFVCQELPDEVRNNKKFLSRVITGDERWVYRCDQKPNSSLLSGKACHFHTSRK
jgi:hypothetical protein